jgi:hypothetical protein
LVKIELLNVNICVSVVLVPTEHMLDIRHTFKMSSWCYIAPTLSIEDVYGVSY